MAAPSVPGWLGPYELLRRLGAGGMGVVYEARHPQLDRRVAVKLLSAAHDARLVERFQREGRVLARVRHPGVVEVHEAGVAPEGPYLVQELIEGEPLDALVKRTGPLPPREAARIAAEVAEALAAVHAAGALHRDLKPHNVVLRPDGRPVLIDFGLVRDLEADRLTRTGEVMGSLSYMPPEQVEGDGEVDERTDVYGLGALLYHLLVGGPPFEGPTAYVVARILDHDPPWPRAVRREVPAGLDALVRRALAKRQADRFPSARAMGQALQEHLRGEAPARARAWPALALVACGAALAAGWGVWGARRVDGPAGEEPAPAATRALRAPPPSGSPAPAGPAPLWRVSPPRELAYLLSMHEEAHEGQLDLQARLLLTVEEAAGERPVRLRGRVGWLRIASDQRSSGMGLAYDTRQPDRASPFFALQALLEASFACRLDPQDGAVLEMRGWDAMGRDPDLAAMRNVINDAYMRGAMHALTAVRGPACAVAWEPHPQRPGEWTVSKVAPAALAPAVVRADPRGSEFGFTGRARYHDGRLIDAALTQDGPRTTRWSMTLE